MGNIGLRRMKESLEWRHQIPNLLAAYGYRNWETAIAADLVSVNTNQ